MNRSALPIRFIGHIRSNSLFQVRSPRCTVRNFPNVITLPTDCAFSVGSLSFGLWLGRGRVGPPPPRRGGFVGFARRGDDAPVEAGGRNGVTWLGDRALRFAIEFRIG